MTVSLRRLARSRRLAAMGVLAWLMLAANSLAAASSGMTGMLHAQATHAMVAMTGGHHAHDVSATPSRCCVDAQAGCCGDMPGQACHCAAMCSTTLPPSEAVVLTPAAMTARYVMPLPGSAPSLHVTPPLRPPAI